MKNVFLKTMSVMLALALTTSQAFAAPIVQGFSIKAAITAASGVNFAVSKITSNANGTLTFSPQNTTTLDFATLPFVTKDAQGNTLNIFLPQFFWGVDVGSTGAGNPDVQIQYEDVLNPNATAGNGRAGLQKKGIATVFRVEQSVNQQGNLVDNPILIKSDTLSGFTGAGVSINDETQLAGGFFRMFLGISTGAGTEPTGAQPFTALDAPGTYSGTLTLTATFD